MATWTTIQNLKMILQTGGPSCNIYANGLNTVRIIITFAPYDEHGIAMTHAPSLVWNGAGSGSAQLLDYVTAAPLSYEASSGWTYSDTASDYNVVPTGSHNSVSSGGQNSLPPGTPAGFQYSAYVYCFPAVSAMQIGIRIVTHAGKVYYNSLITPNDAYPPGGSIHSLLSITPLPAITYDKSNITYDATPFAKSGDITQTNYYLAINNALGHFIKRAVFPDDRPGPYWFFRGHIDNYKPCWNIYWDLGAPPDDTYCDDANFTPQQINSRGPNVLTFTKLQSDTKNSDLPEFNCGHTGLIIYDECGNSGTYSLIVVDDEVYDIDVVPGYQDVDTTTSGGHGCFLQNMFK